MTKILRGFAFLCKLGLLFFKPRWATKFKYEKKNEKNSGRSSKKTRISIQQIKGLFTWKWGTPGR